VRVFGQFEYPTLPFHVTEEAELAALANWREVTNGWMGADDARSVD
jgi:hypothetical protein